MTDPNIVPDGVRLAARARAIADEPCLAELHDPLITLVESLETGDHLEAWCELDLLHAFDDVAIDCSAPRADLPGRRAVGFLDTIRLPLIFVPIALTWFAVGRAAAAYGGGEDPFIQQWQSGFEGRIAGWERLSSIATLDMLLIIVVLVLTAVCVIKKAGFDAQDSRDEAAHRSELRALLIDISVALSRVSLASPLRFRSELTSAAAELREMGAAAVGATETAQSAITGLNAAADALVEVAREDVAREQDLRTSVDALRGEFEMFKAAYASTAAELGNINSNLEAISRESTNVANSLDVTTATHAQTLDQLQRSMAVLDEQRSDLTAMAVDHAAELASERTAYSGVVTDLRNAAGGLQAPMERLSSLVAELDSTLRGLGGAADAIPKATAGFADELRSVGTEQTQIAAQLQTVSRDLARIIPSISAAIAQTRDDLEALRATIRDTVEQ